MPRESNIQIRRDTYANWESINPILSSGEITFDSTNNKIKVGNGTSHWLDLDYLNASVILDSSTETELNGIIKGDGTNLSVATEGVDYETETSYGLKNYVTSGVLVKPTLTNNNGGNITLGDGEYIHFSDGNFSLPLIKTSVGSADYDLTNNVTNYIVFDCDSDPKIYVTTDRSGINQSCVIPIFTIYREDDDLHILDWDEMAKGLSNKLSDRLVRTRRFEVETGGLLLGESTGRIMTLTGGYLWYGATRKLLDSVNSSTDICELFYHSSGNWTKEVVTQYDNFYYDNGTNRVELTNTSKYAVNWVFRAVEDNENHLLIVLGNGDYKLSEAEASTIPSDLPSIINSQSILVGRIIVEKNGSTAQNISSAFSTIFSRTPITSHDELSNLQGGTTNEYYHLTNTELTNFNSNVTLTNNIIAATKEPNGWEYGSEIDVSYDSIERKITLTRSAGLNYWVNGVRYTLTSPWTSPVAHDDISNTYYLSAKAGGTIAWSTDLWNFYDAQIAIVKYKFDGTNSFAQRETHNTMPWTCHRNDHFSRGTFLYSGGTATLGTYVEAAATASDANNTPGIDETVIADEDCYSTLAALIQGTYTTMYVGASSSSVFNLSATLPYTVTGTFINYNNATLGTLVESTGNRFLNVYVIAFPATSDVNSQKYRYIFVQPQAQYTSLTLAQAESIASINLGELNGLLSEMVGIQRIIYRTGTGVNYSGATGSCRLEKIELLKGSKAQQFIIPSTNIIASNVGFTPAGTIVAENVQAAIEELDSEKLQKEYSTSLSDENYSGIIISGLAKGALAIGDVITLTDTSNTRWELADANVITAAAGDARGLLGINLTTAVNAGDAIKILLNGTIASAAFPDFTTLNAPLYLSETPGDMTLTAPTTANSVTRILGFSITSTVMYFNPSNNYITHA